MGRGTEMMREPSRFSAPGASSFDMPGSNEVVVATVGHDESLDRWIAVESGQVLVEVTYRTGTIGARGRCRVAAGVMFGDLVLGEQVVVAKVASNDSHAIIVGRLNDLARQLPGTVAGVDTGAGDATGRGDQAGGPMFTFWRGRDGRLLAVQTGARADLLVHSGAGVEVKAGDTSAIHLNGLTHLAASWAAAPAPPTITAADVPDLPEVGAGAGVLPGVPGVPYVAALSETLTDPPYLGPQDGIVRAKDPYQSTFGTDATWWFYVDGLDLMVQAQNTLHEAASAYMTALSTLVPATINAAKVVYDAAFIVFQTAKATFDALQKPTSIQSGALSASWCTCGDATPAP